MARFYALYLGRLLEVVNKLKLLRVEWWNVVTYLEANSKPREGKDGFYCGPGCKVSCFSDYGARDEWVNLFTLTRSFTWQLGVCHFSLICF